MRFQDVSEKNKISINQQSLKPSLIFSSVFIQKLTEFPADFHKWQVRRSVNKFSVLIFMLRRGFTAQ